ncbi:interferon alpha-inducible protein 27-like protein 2B isoform X2 [Cavia porcellus]|uniref:interferon alpha-inducible protein 27-like protein 2B isoform X2 n=1 Tax=Cavia porcellus TaxID=10141 RepID=UPI000661949F|nr:interferon alpha-inducible protein 27-like protein 2B isoform X1 [Cavia porcellus]
MIQLCIHPCCEWGAVLLVPQSEESLLEEAGGEGQPPLSTACRVRFAWTWETSLCTMPLGTAGQLAFSLASKVASAVAKVGGEATGSSLYDLSAQGLTLVSQTASPAVTALGQWLETLNVGGILQGSSDATSMAASSVGAKVAIAAAGGGLAVVSVPLVLSAVGFTGAGITASSLAAKMMSVTAIANGGGVPAGSLVATLQSVGAAGLSMSSNVILGSMGSAASLLMSHATGP